MKGNKKKYLYFFGRLFEKKMKKKKNGKIWVFRYIIVVVYLTTSESLNMYRNTRRAYYMSKRAYSYLVRESDLLHLLCLMGVLVASLHTGSTDSPILQL